MPIHSIVITEHEEEVIESLVRPGWGASEVLREGLRLVEQREAREPVELNALRKAAQAGWDDLAAGRFVDVDDTFLGDYLEELGDRAPSRVAAR